MRMMNVLLLLLLSSFLANAQTFTLQSRDLGGQLTSEFSFNGFGCKGQNLSPQLMWTHPPAGTKSFAITIHDPSAPTGSGWWHWVVFDIPASSSELKQGAGKAGSNLLPAGAIQGRTDLGTPGYMGPCPPEGDAPHPYIITVYALGKEKLGLNADASPAIVGFNLNANLLAKASLIVYYKR
jgi:Raf kinase inhibitor-like YbhB/YbcL family protein